MDMDDEMKRLKWLLIVGVVFLISGFFSWREMKYAVFGAEANATLVRVYESEERGRRGRRIQKLNVEYQFTDAGATRKESDKLSIDSDRPTGKTVPIQYISGSPGSSRIAGHTQKFWLLIFLGSLAFMAFKIYQLVRVSKA